MPTLVDHPFVILQYSPNLCSTVFRHSDFCVAGRIRPVEPQEPDGPRGPKKTSEGDINEDLLTLPSTSAIELVISGLSNLGNVRIGLIRHIHRLLLIQELPLFMT
jgi:hypothetical protein